ncbi:uncharacterized protein LOC129258763 [Lytechinus pictus]|uniref:uncharacterized protein LOC129258763 n=1 Tax=Lytechinus pictus TaxID=7653 RepID=UPI0030BA17E1
MDGLKDSENDGENCSAELPVVFQCQGCRSILSDSLAFLTANDDLKTITVNRVNSSVGLSPRRITSTHGVDQGSTYSPVECKECHNVVGKVYKTTPRLLDDLRDYYTLDANKLLIYQIGSSTTSLFLEDGPSRSVPSITDLRTLKDTVMKLQVLMCTMHQRIANIEQSLEIENTQPAGPHQGLPQALGSKPIQNQQNQLGVITSFHERLSVLSSVNDGRDRSMENLPKKKSQEQSGDSYRSEDVRERRKIRERGTKRLKKSEND